MNKNDFKEKTTVRGGKFSEDEEQKLIAMYKKRHSDLQQLQANYLPIYDELAIMGDPRNAYFRTKRSNGDLSHLVAKTDDTLQSALPLHAAVMNSLLTPSAYVWHDMRFCSEEAQTKYGAILAKQNEIIYNKRYTAASNFVCAINTLYINNALYGWYVLEVTKDIARKQVVYRALPIREFVIDQNERGFVDTFYRKVTMTYRHLRQMFPNYTPKKAQNGEDLAWLNKEMTLLHIVEPSLSSSDGKFDSVYIDLTDGTIIKKTLESKSKYIAGRASTFSNTNDPYGFSPVMCVMPSTKNLNAVSFDLIKATHHASRYDLIAGDDVVNPRNYPDVTSIINGGMDSEGRPQVAVLSQRDLPTLDYMIKGWQKRISDALFTDTFMLLQETQSRSATDAMLKANERANMIAPLGDRFSRELLQPLLELEVEYYSEMTGVLPQFPEEAKDEEYDIILDNPLLRGQRLDSVNSISNLAGTLGVVKSLSAEFNVDRTKEYLAGAYNVPLDIFNTQEEKQQIIDAENEQANLQLLAENAGGIGKGISDLSNAASGGKATTK